MALLQRPLWFKADARGKLTFSSVKHRVYAQFRNRPRLALSHGRKGVTRFVLGSVSEAVARHAHCSVEIASLPSNS
ncbi:MAG: universal stress protein [Terriglobales bacterium]